MAAIIERVDNTVLMETIRGLEDRIPDFNSKYIKAFFISADFVALILTFQVDEYDESKKIVPVDVNGRKIVFTRVDNHDEWSSMVKQFYVYMNSTVSQDCISICKGRMQKSSQMWKRHSEYLAKRNAP